MRVFGNSFLFLLISLFIMLPGPIRGQVSPALDTEMGILGYRLEAPQDSMPGHLKSLGKSRKLYKFRPEPDSVYFEGVLLSSFRIFFFKGELHSIVMKTNSDADTDRVLAGLQKRFGQGKSEDMFDGIRTWQGKKIYLRYEKNYLTSEGIFSFYSYRVNRDYEIAEYNRIYED